MYEELVEIVADAMTPFFGKYCLPKDTERRHGRCRSTC